MRFIPTRIHGLLDYTVGVLLILSPLLLGFGRGGAETIVPAMAGAGTIFYSLMTNYEWGMGRALSMRVHLGLDMAAGILLAASPWLFGFAAQVYQPHVVFGALSLGLAMTTQTTPDFRSRRHQIA
jgi:hypothetical protein